MQGKSQMCLWIYPDSLKSGEGLIYEAGNRRDRLSFVVKKGGKGATPNINKEPKKFMFQACSEF